jgi:hypothetical protein
MPPKRIPIDDAIRSDLEKSLSRTRTALWILAPLWVGGPLWFGVTQWSNPKNTSTGQLVGVVLLTSWFLAVFAIFPWDLRERVQRLRADLADDHVLELRGPITEKRSSRFAPRRLKIDGHSLRVPLRHYLSLNVGTVVHVRYTPHAKSVLSLERV